MSIDALAYIGINSERLEDWAAFGARFLGLQVVEQTRGIVKFRMDDRKQRIIVRRGVPDTGLTGWEVASAAALDAVAARRKPPLFMKHGDVVEVEISQIGVLRNVIEREA